MREVHQVPPSEFPAASRFGFVLEPDQQVDRVIADFVGGDLRLEIKRAKAAVAAARGVKLWIEIKNAVGSGLDEPQIGITGALHSFFGGVWKVATQSRDAVEQFAEEIFEVAADLIDARDVLDWTFRSIHLR